jgi:hypothetical protein
VKNSFFLVIPAQQKNPELLAAYQKDAVNQWISELPAANLSLSTRLFHEFITGFNSVELPAQQRLDILEMLYPHFLTIEDYLRSRLISSGFPKSDIEQKILGLLISVEKQFTIAYWVVIKEFSSGGGGWFQGKNTALAIQRTIKGLSGIVVTHFMMFLPIPDWVWIDLHSLYKLSVKIKKESTKVPDESNLPSKVNTAENCYKQVLLLSLADPSGLMQKEVQQVYKFIGNICSFVQIEKQKTNNQKVQCIILMDEDHKPYFNHDVKQVDSSMIFLNLLKLYKALHQIDKYSSKNEARFSSTQLSKNKSDKIPFGLYLYIVHCWQGVELKGDAFFSDRLNRYIAIGLNNIHSLQNTQEVNIDEDLEVLAKSFSERELSCTFEKTGVFSIGSLISFRKTDERRDTRSLGIIKKIIISKQDGNVIFELAALTLISFAVTYIDIDANPESEHHKALLFGTKNKTGEKSYIILQSFMHKNEDVLRMFMNNESFPIVLGDRKNIGIGYWQFECRRIEEKQIPKNTKKTKKKGYDFL